MCATALPFTGAAGRAAMEVIAREGLDCSSDRNGRETVERTGPEQGEKSPVPHQDIATISASEMKEGNGE